MSWGGLSTVNMFYKGRFRYTFDLQLWLNLWVCNMWMANVLWALTLLVDKFKWYTSVLGKIFLMFSFNLLQMWTGFLVICMITGCYIIKMISKKDYQTISSPFTISEKFHHAYCKKWLLMRCCIIKFHTQTHLHWPHHVTPNRSVQTHLRSVKRLSLLLYFIH